MFGLDNGPQDLVLKNGCGPIVENLSKDIRKRNVNILLDHEVQKVDQVDSSVSVTVRSGSILTCR